MRSRDALVVPMMRELRRGNVIAVERDGGMLVIDPSRFAVRQSPSVALIANMSAAERDRVLFLDAYDEEHSFGINPFALPPADGEDPVSHRKATVEELHDVLVPFLDIEPFDVQTIALLDNVLTLAACTPGATLLDLPVLVESTLAREMALSFVPYDEDESCFPRMFVKFCPDAFDQMMRHGASILSDRLRRFMARRETLRHVLGQSAPGDALGRLRQRDTVVLRIPNDGRDAPLCQELILRASGMAADDGTEWTSMSTNEVFSSNPYDAEAASALVSELGRQAEADGMAAERDAIEGQIAERTALLEGGDRVGWILLCERLGVGI